MQRRLKQQLSLVMFAQFFIWGSWYVTTSTYLLERLGFTGTQVGFVYSCTAVSAFISPFVSGMLADRYFSAEKLLGFFHIIGGVILFIASFMQQFEWFYPILLLYTIFFVPTFSLGNSLVFHHVIDRARDFSRIRVWGTFGWILAGVIVSFLEWEYEAYPMRLAAASGVLTGFYCLTLPVTPPRQNKELSLREILSSDAVVLLRRRAFVVFLICMTLTRIPSAFYYSFVNPFLNEIGVQAAAGKMAIGQASEILFMLTFPFVFSRLGIKKVLFIGMLMWGGRYLLFAFGGAGSLEWVLFLGILLHGVTYNYTSHMGQIYIDQSVPPHLRSTAQGFMIFITMGFGVLMGSLIAGSVVQQYTLPSGEHLWRTIWLHPGLFGIGVAVVLLLFFHPKGENGRK